MFNKKKYEYRQNLLMEKPLSKVEINHKSIIGKILCKHSYYNLIRMNKNDIFLNPYGDDIEIICPKCGKSKGIMFWEYEGMGYK